jgi:hypothetical protein
VENDGKRIVYFLKLNNRIHFTTKTLLYRNDKIKF